MAGHVTEAVEVLGRAACEYCVSDPDSDLVFPNPLYANICKCYSADNWHKASKYIQDIAGGIAATCPSSKDFFNPEIHDLPRERALGGRASVPTENRLRLVKIIRDLTSSYEGVLTIHAEGSLEARKLSILTMGDFERYRAAAMRAAGIGNPKKHPAFELLPQFPPQV